MSDAEPPVAPGPLRSGAATGARWMSFAVGVRSAVQLVQLFVLGRLLAVEDFGVMAMVWVVIQVAQALADAGVSNAIVHHQDASRRELSSLYWLHLAVGLALWAGVWAAAPLLALLFGEPGLVAPLRLTAILLPLLAAGQQFGVMMQRELRFRRVAVIELAASLVGFAVGVGLALRGAGLYALVGASVSAVAFQSAASLLLGRRSFVPQLHFALADCRRFLRFGAFQVAERLVNQLGAQIDVLLIGSLLGPTALGYYSMAQRIAQRAMHVLNPAVARVAAPIFARVQDDDARLRQGFLRVSEAIGAAMIPLQVGLVVFARPLVRTVLGEAWEPVVPLLQILAANAVILALGNPTGSLLLAKGRPDIGLATNLVRIAVDTPVLLWVTPLGVVPAALAILGVRIAVMFPIGLWLRSRLISLRVGDWLATVSPFLAAALLTIPVVGLGGRWLGIAAGPWSWLPAAALAGLLYAGLLLCWQPARLRRMWAEVSL